MKLTLDISVKPEKGLPLMFLTAQKDGKTLDLKYDPALTLSDLFEKFEGMDVENPILLETTRSAMQADGKYVAEKMDEAIVRELGQSIPDNSNKIQREDLVQVTNMMQGLKDKDGSEMVDRGIVQGGIYRVMKINQNMIVMPDKPDELTAIISSYEVVDDKAAIQRRLAVFPSEVTLYKKRTKDKSIKTNKVSEILKCSSCGKENAFVLNGSKFEGKCGECGADNSIERITDLCPNEKCLSNGERSKMNLYQYDGKFSGACGQCKATVTK